MPDSSDKKLLQLLEEIIDIVIEDVCDIYIDNHIVQKRKQEYLNTIRSHLKRYDHHQGTKISDESIIYRFQRETAILHVATSVLVSMLKTDVALKVCWPVHETSGNYSWYEITNTVDEQINIFARLIESHPNSEMLLIDLCDQLLTSTEERYIGEFYTPPSIVHHLINTSKLQPSDLIAGKKVVDPACGGGMILTSIAKRVVDYAIQSKIDGERIIAILSENLYGFDIQPFAITLCRSSLLHVVLPLLDKTQDSLSLFHNIKLLDPLECHDRFWTEKIFSYVIANPPFMSVKRATLDISDAFDDVIYGHPNLYVLFLWWAIQSSKIDAVVSVLLPQSMLIGNYFLRLRKQLAKSTTLIDITRMIDRKGIVGSADQQMMTICLKVGSTTSKRHRIALRVTRNGDDIDSAAPIRVKQHQVIRNGTDANFWIVSEDKLDYEIEEALANKSQTLGELESLFQLGNGGYVWNQNKELLSPTRQTDSIPLISSASISAYDFEFPYTGSHRTHERLYSKVTEKVERNIRTGPVILNQRTTPTKVGRRLICSMPHEFFFNQYPQFFLENHVNFISSVTNSINDLYGLLAWLNSDIINFVFQLRNGTTQVSIFELKLLPVHVPSLSAISELGKSASKLDANKREKVLSSINDHIFKNLDLNTKHKKRVEEVLKRKEKHK